MVAKVPERIALFDESHGQANWQQTGFTSRLIETNFSGLARILRRSGLRCVPHRRRPLDVRPGQAEIIVIPPPTGLYDAPPGNAGFPVPNPTSSRPRSAPWSSSWRRVAA